MNTPVAVIVDTDLALGPAGEKVDDAFALALALASPEMEVVLVTVVAGNAGLRDATTRTRAFLARLGRSDVPVMPGDGPAGGAATSAILDRVLEDPGAVTVVALGPLTTVAAALGADRRAAEAVREIVVMGGRFDGRPSAEPEFNARTDPWSARAVAESGARIRYVGLDVTSRLALGRADLDRLSRGGATARYLAERARARVGILSTARGVACPMHDPLAVLAVTHPDLIDWRAAEVTVESEGLSSGRTRAEFLDAAAAHLATCQVAVAVDADAAKDVLITRLASLG